MESEEKERNWDERRGRKGNTGKMMGLDVMASSENLRSTGSAERREIWRKNA